MRILKFFGFVLGFTFIVGVQPVLSMVNCVVGSTDRAEIPEVTDTVEQNLFTSRSSAPVLTAHTDTYRVIEGDPVSFKIRASVPPRNALSVELFVGVHNTVPNGDIPAYITEPYNRVYQSGSSLELKLFEGLTVQFPAGQREHIFSLNTFHLNKMENSVQADHAVFVVLNPNTQQNNYEVNTELDQHVAGAVVIDKQLEFSISPDQEPVNIGDCTKHRLTASKESFTHRHVLLRYYGWYGDGTHRDESVLWVGIHKEIDVISTEPIPDYVSLSGIVVRVIDQSEYVTAKAPNNRVAINVNGLATGTS